MLKDASKYRRLANGIRDSELFERLLEEFWSWRLHQSPEFASTLGVRGQQHETRLDSFSRDALRRRKDQCEAFLRSAAEIDVTRLRPDDVISLSILREELETFVTGYQWIHYGCFNPLNALEGVHKDYSYWLDAMRFESEQAFSDYITRLSALVTQIHEQISLMRDALKYGLTNHRLSMAPVLETLETLITQPALSSPFFRPFNDSLDFIKVSANQKDKMRTEGASVIQDHVMPAYTRLAQFLSQEYMPRAREGEGVGSLPGGSEYYEAVLRWYLAPHVSALSVHAAGRGAVHSLHGRMDAIREKVGYSGRLEDFIKHANGANKFFYRTEEELLEAYRDIVYNKIPSNLSKLFHPVRLTSLQVQPMPFDGPTSVLMPGSEDGFYPAVFFVNVRNPLKTPKWQMIVTAVQQTIPGRLLQACYAQNQSLPEFRAWREYRKSFAVPFQFPYHTAYTEGWALYAESLAADLGLLASPHEQFGQLHSELYHAAQTVVDTGLHAIGWSREEGVQYLLRVAGVPRSQAEADLDRIVTTPGRAAASHYGLSQLRLERANMQERLGVRFDVRSFHHAVLRLGPASMHTVHTALRHWGAELSASPVHSPHVTFTVIAAAVAQWLARLT